MEGWGEPGFNARTQLPNQEREDPEANTKTAWGVNLRAFGMKGGQPRKQKTRRGKNGEVVFDIIDERDTLEEISKEGSGKRGGRTVLGKPPAVG